MSRVFSRSRFFKSAPAASLFALGAVMATSSQTAYQDLTDFMSAVSSQNRWQAHLVAAPQGSIHRATFYLDDAAWPGTSGFVSAGGPTIAVNGRMLKSTLEGVNRSAKGDLMMTRTPETVASDMVPNSGTIWRMDDIFSARDDEDLPKVAFFKAGAVNPDIVLASAGFRKPLLATDGPVMVASIAPMPGKRANAEPLKASVVAYAAPEQSVDAPFDAVIGGGNTQTIASEPVVQPKTRPKPGKIKEWLRKRRRGAGNQHAWMKNKLPRGTKGRKQQTCLTNGIYFEARSEPVSGQAAVGQVILNRVRNPAYPNTVCGVVYQNRKMRNRCQFSFACDGIRDVVRSKGAWKVAKKVAKDVTSGRTWLPEVADATHYHATYVRPRWARSMKKTDKIGLHIFYRTYGGGWS